MQAIVAHEYGPPENVLRLEDIDPPEAGDHDVIVRAQASSVNPADWHLVRGEPRVARLQLGLRRPKYPVLGCDVAGVVHAIGNGVTGFEPGDAVFGSPFMRGFGAFAEYVRVPEECLAPTPADLSAEQAAALPLAASTALQGLRDRGRVEAGQRVLVIGAAGGVGTFAVQIAKAIGAEVTALCSTRNVDLVGKLGADHVIDRTREDVTRSDRRYDVILQVSGDAAPSALRRILTPKGVLVLISGDSEGRWIGAVSRLVAARLSSPFVGPSLLAVTVKPNADDLRHLAGLVEAGTLTPVVDRTYPLAEVPQALRYLESGQARGKVVVTHP